MAAEDFSASKPRLPELRLRTMPGDPCHQAGPAWRLRGRGWPSLAGGYDQEKRDEQVVCFVGRRNVRLPRMQGQFWEGKEHQASEGMSQPYDGSDMRQGPEDAQLCGMRGQVQGTRAGNGLWAATSEVEG